MYLSSVSSRLLLHDANSWDLKISNGCHDGIIREISWSDDSKYMLQINSSGQVEILSPTDRDVRTLQHIPLKDTWSASFHRDGHRDIAVGSKNGTVKIWDTKNKSITKTLPAPTHPSCVQILSYDIKNTSLAATMTNGDTIIYSLVSNVPVQTIKLTCSKSISAMKFHHEIRSIVGLATEEGHIILRDVNAKKDKAFFEDIHASPVSDFAFSPINKDVMVSSGYDKIIQVYDIRLQNIISTVKTTHILTCVAINTNNQVALGSKNGDVLIYDLRDLSRPLKTLKGHDKQVSKVAFQPTRRKQLSTDISLREEVETISLNKVKTPTTGRSSDIFFMNDTPPTHQNISNTGLDNKADQSSFFDKVNFETSNNFDFEKKIDEHESRLDLDRNMSKISTPVHKSGVENLVIPSPLLIGNGIQCDTVALNGNIVNNKLCNEVQTVNNTDTKGTDEFKDLMSDIADENRNYFLHIMMAFTKQNLFLEKQLDHLSQEVKTLRQNQDSLMETNRILSLQIEKMQIQQSM